PISAARLAYLHCHLLKRPSPDGLEPEARLDGPEYLPHPDDVGAADGRLPVLRVGVEDAHRFARWLGGLLPSKDEWDVAAGRWEKDAGAGPFLPNWKEGEIAVGRMSRGPMRAGEAA